MNTTFANDSWNTVMAASNRSSDIPESQDAYGWLIGSWELAVVGYDDEENVTRSTGEAHFAWVLEGRAVQDVFINPRRSERGPSSPKFANWYGTTLRVFDPSIGSRCRAGDAHRRRRSLLHLPGGQPFGLIGPASS